MFSFAASAQSFNSYSYFTQATQNRPGAAPEVDQNRLVQAGLNQGLKKGLGVELAPPAPQAAKAVQPIEFNVDEVVDNVLQFVEKRIQQAKSQGASESELNQMYDQARAGVEQGFSEARDVIQSFGKLDDDLSESIDEAEEGIYEGIDDLQESNNRVDTPVVQNSTPSESDSESVPGTNGLEGLDKLNYRAGYASRTEQFEFELVTQEGDVVSITAYQSQSVAAEQYRARGEDGRLQVSAFEKNYSSSFEYVLQGDLNDDEKAAIADLLSQIDQLSTEFYQGDLDKAFDMALQLKGDPDEIARFSLNLSQQQTVAYEEVRYNRGVPGYAQDALPRGLAEPLADFAAGVREAFESFRELNQPQSLLKQLFDQFDARQNMQALLDPLLGRLSAEDA